MFSAARLRAEAGLASPLQSTAQRWCWHRGCSDDLEVMLQEGGAGGGLPAPRPPALSNLRSLPASRVGSFPGASSTLVLPQASAS